MYLYYILHTYYIYILIYIYLHNLLATCCILLIFITMDCNYFGQEIIPKEAKEYTDRKCGVCVGYVGNDSKFA